MASACLCGLVGVAVAIGTGTARAANITWNDANGTSKWNSSNGSQSNWLPSITPGAADDVYFANSYKLTAGTWSIIVDSNVAVNSIVFTSTNTPVEFTTTSSTIALGSGNITKSSTASGNQTFLVPITLGTSGLWTINGSGTLSVASVISGSTASVGLTKTGTGILSLSGSNTYTGTTAINQGTLQIATIQNGGTAGTLGASSSAATNLVLGGGTLDYTGATATTDRGFQLTASTTSTILVGTSGTNLTFTGTTTGAGTLVKTGAGTLTLGGSTGYSGATTVSGGTLALGATAGVTMGTAISLQDTTSLLVGRFASSVGSLSTTGTTGVFFTGSNTTTGSLALSGALTLNGSNDTLNLNFTTTGSAVRYDLITYTSRSGTFDHMVLSGTGAAYRLVYGGLGSGTVSLAQVANQTFAATAGTTRALVSSTFTVTGTLTNTSASAAYAPLDVSLTGSASANTFLGFSPAQGSTINGNSSQLVTGTLTALSSVGTQTWTMTNSDSLAATPTATTSTGTVQVVANRTYTPTSIALGRFLTSAPSTGTATVTSTGTTGTTASGTVGAFSNSVANGLTLSLASGTNGFNGGQATQSGTYTTGGSYSGAVGAVSGSFTATATNEFGGTSGVAVNYTGTALNQRQFTVTTSTVALGRYLITGALPSATTTVTSTGDFATTASGTLLTPSTSNGLTLSLTSGSTNFAGATVSQTTGYVVSGSATTAGLLSGSFSTGVSAELSTINDVVVNYTANPVNQRAFTVTTSTVALGRYLVTGATPSGTTSVSSSGSNATTASGTLGAFSSSDGLSLALTSGSVNFAGAAASQQANYTISGSLATAGVYSGSFASTVGAEFGTINDVVVHYTANPVNQRTFTTSTSTLALGFVHQGPSLSGGTLVVTSTGLNQSTASGTLGAFSGGPSGFSLGITSGSAQFNGASASQSTTYTLSGTTTGVFSGTFTSSVTGEFAGIPAVAVAISGTVYSGLSNWSTDGGGDWGTLTGTGASAFGLNWPAAQGSPGVDASYTDTDTATFGSALTSGTADVYLAGANPSLNTLTFDNANHYALRPSGGGTQITLSATDSALVATVSGTHAIHTGVALASNASFDVAAGGRLDVHGLISGTNGLTTTGAATLALIGANTYTGPTTISSGTLQLGNGGTTGSLATASAITNDGTLAFNRSNTVTQGTDFSGGIIAGSGGLVQAGSGLLVLNVINSYTGPTSILSGTISASEIVGSQQGSNIGKPTANEFKPVNLANQGTLLYTGSTATYTRGFALSSGGGGLVVQSPGTVLQMSGNNGGVTGSGTFFVGGAGQVSIISVLQQAGGLRYNGTGMLTLKGNNTFTGMTFVDSGTLKVDDTNGGGGRLAGSVTVNPGGLLGGVGIIDGAITGGGFVSPGNSPGVLTSGTYDPTGGGDSAFEFTLKNQEPSYNNPGSIQNDVLHLTGVTPFTANMTADNVIDVYIASGQLPLQLYDYLEGGFFADGMSADALLLKVQDATFVGWVQTAGAGVRTFNGINYNPITSNPELTGLTVTTKYYENQNFGGGPVSGSVTQFVVIPEPSTIASLVGAGVILAVAGVRRRRGARGGGTAGRPPTGSRITPGESPGS